MRASKLFCSLLLGICPFVQACDDDDDTTSDANTADDANADDANADDANADDATTDDATTETCDPTTCTGDRYCFEQGETSACVLDATPSITAAGSHAYQRGDRLSIKLVGEDAGRDVVGLDLQFLNSHGELIDFVNEGGESYNLLSFDFDNEESVFGLESFNAKLRVDGLSSITDPAKIHARLRDQHDHVSSFIELPLDSQPIAQNGEACDLLFVDNVCVEGTDCVQNDEGSFCLLPPPPTITSFEAWFNHQTDALGIKVEGDVNAFPVEGIDIYLYDEEGNDLGYKGIYHQPADQSDTFSSLEQNENHFSGVFNEILTKGYGFERAYKIKMAVFDENGWRSETMELELQEPPVRNINQSCDANTALNRCEKGSLCQNATGSTSICQTATASCPAAWDVQDLNACTTSNENRFVCSDDLNNANIETDATCRGPVGSAPAIAYSFKAPVAGRWHFETSGTDEAGDTTLFARQFCRYTTPDAEIACNDDISPLNYAWSAFDLELEANEEIYIFVTYFMQTFNTWIGTYSLEATLN